MAPKSASRAVKLYGTDVPDAKRRELKAGAMTAVLDNGALRYIRYKGVEVLRGIAYLVRDKNWGTYGPIIENLKVKQGTNSFTISYTATCKDATQGIRYRAEISAKADGSLVFSAVGTPLTDFLTNRTGFVVLHPLEGVADKPVEVVHTDGKREKRKFPKYISPGQPIFEIRSLKHTVMPGLTATVLMEGNKFEMEDHRNWMDASYKTYVCSLLDLWPYTLPKGKDFTQTISLTLSGRPAASAGKRSSSGIEVAIGGTKGRLPRFGTGVPMKEAAATLAKSDLVAIARPAELICQIDGREQGQAEAAQAFAALKDKTGASLTLEIILPAKAEADREVAEISESVKKGGLVPDAVVVTQMHDLKSFQPNTPRPWGPSYEEMAAATRKHFPGVRLGGGMLSYFTELNRKPVPKGLFDFITHTVCPIVHMADDISVMETLEALPWIITSTRNMIGKTPYQMGPSSIPCRDNPYGAAVAENPGNGRVCLSDMDPRQRGLFGAAWTMGLAAATAQGGLDAVALSSTTGPQGLIHRKASFEQPWFDQSGASVYPVYHVVAGLGPLSGGKRVETCSSAPARIAALAAKTRAGQVLWLANLTGEKQDIKVTGFAGPAEVHVLDDSNFAKATRAPDFLAKAGERVRKVSRLELGPYATVRLASV
jgi:hypothetical protein